MSSSVLCANCGVPNDPETEICDCGHDLLVRNKLTSALNIALDTIEAERRKIGLSPLFNTTALQQAALATSGWVGTDSLGVDEVLSDYRERASELGYPGSGLWGEVGFALYKQFLPRDISESDIVEEFLKTFTRTAMTDGWEDYGIGFTSATHADHPGIFWVCVVFGVGLTDGHAFALTHINEERRKENVPPLQIDRRLRDMARSYREMTTNVSQEQVEADAPRYGYLAPGYRARWIYGISYIPCPEALVSSGLNITQIGRAVADRLLEVNRERLVRIDWQHIGLAVDTNILIPPDEPRVPSFLAEYLLGWRLPEHARRPDHFPPPPELDTHGSERQFYVASPGAQNNPELWEPARPGIPIGTPRQHTQRRRRWWWPF